MRSAPDPAWIFYAPDQAAAAAGAFGSPTQGPYAFPESLFLAKLAGLHVDYRIVHLGVLDAVVTAVDVHQEQVGMGGPLFP